MGTWYEISGALEIEMYGHLFLNMQALQLLFSISYFLWRMAPYLVMPYMANGSLLSYLRNERPNLTIADEAGDELVLIAYI